MTCAAFPWQCGGWGAAARPVPSLSGCSSLHFLLLLSCHPAGSSWSRGELPSGWCTLSSLCFTMHSAPHISFFFPFVLWLYANFVRDEDQGYLFLLIINSLSILFFFLPQGEVRTTSVPPCPRQAASSGILTHRLTIPVPGDLQFRMARHI